MMAPTGSWRGAAAVRATKSAAANKVPPARAAAGRSASYQLFLPSTYSTGTAARSKSSSSRALIAILGFS